MTDKTAEKTDGAEHSTREEVEATGENKTTMLKENERQNCETQYTQRTHHTLCIPLRRDQVTPQQPADPGLGFSPERNMKWAQDGRLLVSSSNVEGAQ